MPKKNFNLDLDEWRIFTSIKEIGKYRVWLWSKSIVKFSFWLGRKLKFVWQKPTRPFPGRPTFGCEFNGWLSRQQHLSRSSRVLFCGRRCKIRVASRRNWPLGSPAPTIPRRQEEIRERAIKVRANPHPLLESSILFRNSGAHGKSCKSLMSVREFIATAASRKLILEIAIFYGFFFIGYYLKTWDGLESISWLKVNTIY